MRSWTVNFYCLRDFWTCIGEGTPAGADPPGDLRYPENVRRLVDEYLRPQLSWLGPLGRERVKDTFRYALNKYDKRDLRQAMELALAVAAPPKDIHRFYVDVWRLLFGDEPWELSRAELSEFHDLDDQLADEWEETPGPRGHEGRGSRWSKANQ